MYLKSIGARNFLGYKKLELEVQPGLTLIDGVNHHFATASSGGSGKSSLQEAIAFPLFGRTVRDIPIDKVIYEFGKRDYSFVWNEFVDEHDQILRVERYRNHENYGNDARLLLDGKDAISGRYIRKGKGNTNSEISDRIGFDFDLFKRAVILHSRKTESFDSVKDRYLKQITERLIGMPDFEPLLNRVKDSGKKISFSIDSANSNIGLIKQSIEDRKASLEKLRRKNEEFREEHKQRKVKLKADIEQAEHDLKVATASLKKWVKRVRREKKRLIKLKVQRDHAEANLDQIENDNSGLLKEVADKRARKDLLTEENKEQRKLEGTTCPTCKQTVSKEHVKKAIDSRYKELETLLTWLTEAKARESNGSKTEQRAKEHLDQLSKDISLHERRKDKYFNLAENRKDNIQQYAKELARLRKQKEEENPYEPLIEEAERYIVKKQNELEELRVVVKKAKSRYLYYEFWRRGFGPSGIRSYVLDAVCPVLNRIANIYLDILMDGNMMVELSTVKRKKDGTYSDKFEVNITNNCGSSELNGSCDNELHSVDLSLNLAMADVLASRIPGGFSSFMFVDQFLDLLDSVRGRKGIQILNNKTNEEWCKQNQIPHKRSIFWITHREALKGLVGQKIIVEKRAKVCKITSVG